MSDINTEKTVHGLWISGHLSPLEWLTIHSYIRHGFIFFLWTYENFHYPLPQGAYQRDAGEILPKDMIFSYRSTNQFGHGKGSYAGFSDIFRYALLSKLGGWWTDMDVTCLNNLDFHLPYVFRAMKTTRFAVGNILYAQPDSALMNWCYEESIKKINDRNKDWLLPVRILNEGIRRFGLSNYIISFTNPDSWPLVSRYLLNDPPLHDWKAFHWMHEEFRRLSVPKYQFIPGSTLQKLLLLHDIDHAITEGKDVKRYRKKVSLLNYLMVNWRYFPSWLFRGRI